MSISGKFDPDEIAANVSRDRDRLWAEAAYFEAAGESLVLPKHLWAIAAEGQRERMIIDPWQERLSELLDGRSGVILSNDIYEMLGIPLERRSGANGQRAAAILEGMGYKRKQGRWGPGGKQVWGYILREEEG